MSQPERNTLYWHYSVPPLPEEGEEGTECFTCSLSVLIKPTLMEIVETLNPGQPPLPDWVYNGAILGRPRPRHDYFSVELTALRVNGYQYFQLQQENFSYIPQDDRNEIGIFCQFDRSFGMLKNPIFYPCLKHNEI